MTSRSKLRQPPRSHDRHLAERIVAGKRGARPYVTRGELEYLQWLYEKTLDTRPAA